MLFSHLADSTSITTNSSDTVGLKVGISFAVLAAGLLIAAIVAKLVNIWFNRRRTVSDNGSDISENTRDLIQTRLVLIRMKQRDIDRINRPNIKSIFTRWSEKVKNRTKTKEKTPKSAEQVLTVEQVIEVNENITSGKSSPRSPRLSIFSGAQNGVRKTSKDIPNRRNSAKVQNISPTRSNPVVGKDEPISSKPHGVRKTSKDIPNSRNSTKVQNLSPTRSNSIVEKDTPVSSKPHVLSSSPVDASVLSSENKQTTKTVLFEEPVKNSQPPDISS